MDFNVVGVDNSEFRKMNNGYFGDPDVERRIE